MHGQADTDLGLVRAGGARAPILRRTIPAGCQITNARLSLYAASYKSGRTLQSFRLNGTTPLWTEGSVNWNNQPATTGTAATAPSRNNPGYIDWNVTSMMSGMYSNNKGFLIRDASENGGGMEQGFNSREKTDNPPRLIITFG